MADEAYLAGAGLAGGVLAAELLETLLEGGILSLNECRGVLSRAMTDLAPINHTEVGIQAQRIIESLQAGKFAARG